MKFVVLSGLLALSGLATATTINFSGYSDNFDCSGTPNINTVLDENQCQSGGIESFRAFPTSDDSNGCFIETYKNSNCQIYAGRVGSLSGGDVTCVGQVNPNTGELRRNFSFRLVCPN
ncbi:hypothetical protein KC332_g1394 [Hortaea werneckii]|nr:hypothetical protein KC358_g1438 [Hortaea werneckii]KAI6852568.1 hypothetical protein KC350_g781 [Hortaea werneckii]KAI6944824.1 hypothetical protein KC341_g536 [Hortaea werneckii]KAI6951127.1 hypothetical protein KC348_g252 [Hortaea werneckii]KAI6983091.1 hypothetical protein KC321_g265 [Hortaea werneckii]